MSDKVELLPCPFCGMAARLESNHDWHRIIVDHDEACIFLEPEVSMVPATDDQLSLAVADWNRRAVLSRQAAPAVPDGYVLVTLEQLEKHTTTAWECPPQSLVVLASSLKRLHDKNAAVPPPVAAPEPAVRMCMTMQRPVAECGCPDCGSSLIDWPAPEAPTPTPAAVLAGAHCACGDIYPVGSYGAGFIDGSGMCPN